MDWRVDWTTDYESWHEKWFSSLDEAREFSHELKVQNEGNPEFWIAAQRLCIVWLPDFFDDSIPAGAIRLA